jgi:hypothetical protein
MAEGETDLEQARAKAAGLERWFRKRLLNELCVLFVVLIAVEALISTASPQVVATTLLCVSVSAVIGLGMAVRTFLILRELRNHPLTAVARLTKWRKLKRAGFVPVE